MYFVSPNLKNNFGYLPGVYIISYPEKNHNHDPEIKLYPPSESLKEKLETDDDPFDAKDLIEFYYHGIVLLSNKKNKASDIFNTMKDLSLEYEAIIYLKNLNPKALHSALNYRNNLKTNSTKDCQKFVEMAEEDVKQKNSFFK